VIPVCRKSVSPATPSLVGPPWQSRHSDTQLGHGHSRLARSPHHNCQHDSRVIAVCVVRGSFPLLAYPAATVWLTASPASLFALVWFSASTPPGGPLRWTPSRRSVAHSLAVAGSRARHVAPASSTTAQRRTKISWSSSQTPPGRSGSCGQCARPRTPPRRWSFRGRVGG
jgi:hypothetical protein